MIKTIKEEMEWFGFKLTNEQVEKHIKTNKLKFFDTLERENYLNFLAKTITKKKYLMNSDIQEYKKTFFYLLEKISKNMGYMWNG